MFRGTQSGSSLAVTAILGIFAVIAALLVISQPNAVAADSVALSGPPERIYATSGANRLSMFRWARAQLMFLRLTEFRGSAKNMNVG
jgi:hypothetical protein